MCYHEELYTRLYQYQQKSTQLDISTHRRNHVNHATVNKYNENKNNKTILLIKQHETLAFGWRPLAFGRRGNATLGSICLNSHKNCLH